MVQVVDDAGGMVLCGRWYTTRLSEHLLTLVYVRWFALLYTSLEG